MSRALQAAICGTLFIGGMGFAAAVAGPELTIVQPRPDTSISGSNLTVRLRVTDIQLGGQNGDGAYVLLRLDDLPPIKSYAERFTFRGVAAGQHQLTAELMRADDASFDPPVIARVRFETSGAQSS